MHACCLLTVYTHTYPFYPLALSSAPCPCPTHPTCPKFCISHSRYSSWWYWYCGTCFSAVDTPCRYIGVRVSVCVSVCVSACASACARVCAYVSAYVSAYVWVCVCLCACLWAFVYVRGNVLICVCVIVGYVHLYAFSVSVYACLGICLRIYESK